MHPISIQSAIGQPRQRPATEARSLILNAVGDGFNTMRAICFETGLENSVVTREIEILKDLYLTVIPGPPVDSFWLKGKEPKSGKVRIENHKATGLAEDKKLSTETEKMLEEIRLQPKLPKRPQPEVEIIGRAIIEPTIIAPEDHLKNIDLNLLDAHPMNPRGSVNQDEQSFADLTSSIVAQGVQQPLVVTPTGNGRFRIVIGHRRAQAAAAAGLTAILCIVRSFGSASEEEEVMLIENIQRQDLKPTQEGRAFKKLYDACAKDLNAVARKVGLTQTYIAARIRLLNLDAGIQIMIDRGELGLVAGEILATLEPRKQMKLLPRAQRMKISDLKVLAAKFRNATENKIPVSRRQKLREKRVTTEEEKFTRTGALRSPSEMGDAAWITVGWLKNAFDDVCVDSCLESKDESICNGCPMPRFVEAVARHRRRSEDE